jgi:hypothetical protein
VSAPDAVLFDIRDRFRITSLRENNEVPGAYCGTDSILIAFVLVDFKKTHVVSPFPSK